jgi:S1-C subfamily serine protease
MIPYSFNRNTFDATFWAKRANDKIVLGVNALPLPDDLKRRLQRNTGVIVDVVVRGTPAFQANILEGDVLLKIANDDVVDIPSFFTVVAKYAGRTVDLQVLRSAICMRCPNAARQTHWHR